MLNIFFLELHPLYTFIALFKKKITPRTSMISVFLFRKKNYSKIKVYCKQNRHFYQDFFEGFQIFLTSSLYRSMWTIGRSQRVEGKKYRPIVCKIRYLVFVGELKKKCHSPIIGELYFILASTCFSPLAILASV
jgi:hypothetical protein